MNTTQRKHSRILFVLLLPLISILYWLSSSPEAEQAAATNGSDDEGWSMLLEAEENLYAGDIAPIKGGGALLVGTGSTNLGSFAYAARIRPDGTLGWRKRFAGASFSNVIATRDRGFLLSRSKAVLMKLDSRGEIAWQKNFGSNTYFYDLQETAEGDLIVVGKSSRIVIVLKLSSTGDVVWQRNWKATGSDRLSAVVLTPDDHYLLFGNLGYDPWIMKLAADGTLVWQKKVVGEAPLYLTASIRRFRQATETA